MVEASRTYHANQAIQLSELLAIKFAHQTFGTSLRRVVKVTEPDGPSTDGGRKARQAIVLAAEDNSSNDIVSGFVDVARRSAELRSYAVVGQQYQARHHVPVDLTKGEYDRFLADLLDFLKMQGIDTRVSNAVPRSSPPAGSARVAKVPAPGLLVAVSVGLGVGLALGYVLFGTGLLR